MKALIGRVVKSLGYRIERDEPLLDAIPADYQSSRFLPRIYRGALDRYLYFLDQLESVREIDGEIVECGVSIGHGTLLFLLFSDYLKRPRDY